MTYAATRSSVLERANRKENGERSTLASRCITPIVSLAREAEIDGGPLRREGRSRRRRCGGGRDDRDLGRAQGGRALGRGTRGQSPAPFESRAAARRLSLRRLRARRRAHGGERHARGRLHRVRERR